jgi:hypothetical protein
MIRPTRFADYDVLLFTDCALRNERDWRERESSRRLDFSKSI